jgi:outer membrane receptor protein involved in Fe transport
MNRPFRWISAAVLGVGLLGLVGTAEATDVPDAMETTDLTGTVKDKTRGALVGAQVIVLTPQRTVVATTATDQSGTFRVPGLTDGQYLVILKYPGLADRQVAVTISGTNQTPLDLILEVAKLGEDVTVTASPGGLSDLNQMSQPINVISDDQILGRAKTVVAQAFDGEPAVNLQRTSPGMAGVFVRGLTGGKVNIFVDGVRYSNGAQRGGVNTFLDLIDPTTLEGIEVLRGTSSAQYGSDALGGSVQFLSNVPALSDTGKPTFSGSITAGAESAHIGGMGNLALAYARARFSLFGSAAQRRTGDYRPGGGEDTHAAVTRFLGVPSSTLYPDRMPDTGFTQTGTQLRTSWTPTSKLLVVANYLRTRQDGANRWDQLLGGDGNLIAQLNDLQLDLAYVRVESLKAGWFDHASATYSFNTQREERVNQGGQGNPAGTITHQPERTTVNGVQFNLHKQLSARQSLLIGGDDYFEKLTSVATDVNPVTGVVTLSRPRVPDQATDNEGGVFAQTNIEAVRDRLSIAAAVRYGFTAYKASQADAPVVNGLPLWPNDSLDTRSATFRVGAALRATDTMTLAASVATGYRAPNMTDLGTLGLTGSGFEVAAPDVAGMSALVGTTADSAAASTGRAVEQVKSETSLNFDGGVRFRTPRVRAEFSAFSNKINGNIQKMALILPQGAVGTTLGGQPITSQTATGAVFVALSSVPVLVRANFDDARIWGVEWLGQFKLRDDTTVGSTYTYMRARDLGTGLPPNIEGGTPAPGGTLWVRYAKSGQKWWAEPYVNFAATQSNLSSLDLGDRRTGATRSRSQIQNFFRRGATVHGWVSAGPNGTFGNSDDILIATGETLTQVQNRVLGVGVDSTPLFTAVPSYVVCGVRVGFNLGRHHTILIDAENLTDQSYRGISWGMDGPGRGVSFRYVARF